MNDFKDGCKKEFKAKLKNKAANQTTGGARILTILESQTNVGIST